MPVSPTVDAVMAEARAKSFTTRSIKKQSKFDALRLALTMVDLTTLEGADSPEKVRSLCRKAVRPFERDEELLGERLPSVAAVCVYPSLVPIAKELLDGTGVNIASVATGFPSGQYPLDVRLRDVEAAVRDGADEIDMVINRGAFLARVGTTRSRTRSARSSRPAARPISRSSSRRASWRRTTTSGAPATWRSRTSPTATSSRRALARSAPRRRCPSRWSCSKPSATRTPRPGRGSAAIPR